MARILVIDDVKDIRSLINKILSDAGHEVLLASDAMEGMEILNSYWVDLLILDIEMPFTNGLQFSETLRSSTRFRFLPIVFLTARNGKNDIHRALEVKAENYLLKPINKDRLIGAVETALGKTKPQEHDRVGISATTLSTRADVIRRLATELISVSEAGFVIYSDQHLETEELVQMDTSFFGQVGIPTVPMKVGAQKQLDDGRWEISLMFCCLNQEIAVKIRSWILMQKHHKAS